MLTVLWPKLTRPAVLIGSMGGSALAIFAWIITCKYVYGTINTTTLASNFSSLAGNVVSLCMGGILSVLISLWKPDNYDFRGTQDSMALFFSLKHLLGSHYIFSSFIKLPSVKIITTSLEDSADADIEKEIPVSPSNDTGAIESEPSITKECNATPNIINHSKVTLAFWGSAIQILILAVVVSTLTSA
jgi:urea-proton symporter